MKRKNPILFPTLILLGLMLSSCGGNDSSSDTKTTASTTTEITTSDVSTTSEESEEQSDDSSNSESSVEKEKINPTIEIDLENGTTFDVETGFVVPEIKVSPSDVSYDIFYTKDEGETLLDGVPTTIGDYSINVKTKETDNYNVVSAFRYFYIRKVANLTLYYGEDELLENGQVFYLGDNVNIYAKSSIDGASITYEYTKDEGATSLGENFPNEEGTYAVNAYIGQDETFASVHVWKWFKLEVKKETPVITFTCNDKEVDLSEGVHWVNGSHSNSSFYVDEPPVITYNVSDDVESTYIITSEEGYSSIDMPTSAGTYVYKVTTVETDSYLSTSEYVLFKLEDRPTKSIPEIHFYFNEEETGMSINGNKWISGAYATSKISYEDIDKITFSVDPSDVTYIVKYTNSDTGYDSETKPTPDSTNDLVYHLYVTTIENDEYVSVSDDVWFSLLHESTKSTPEINFYYDGVLVETSWIGGSSWGEATALTISDLDKISVEISPSEITYNLVYECEDLRYSGGKPTSANGTHGWVIKAISDETNEYESASKSILFKLIEE